MDVNAGSITAYVKLDTTGVISGRAQTERELRNLEGRMREAGRAMTELGRSVTLGLSAPLGLLAGASLRAAVSMDSLKRGLVSVAGSSAEAEKQLVRLKEVAKLPGLGFQEAVQGSVRLQAAGLSAQMAERALKGFGNAIATIGGGKAELDGVSLALTQIAAKGKVSAEEINQLQERVPQIRQAMREAFGTADTELLQKRGIGATEFLDKIITQFEKLPQVTGGAKNSFENFQDAAQKALVAIGDAVLPAATAFLNKLAPAIETATQKFRELPGWAQKAFEGLAIGGAFIGPALYGLGLLSSAIANIQKGLGLIAGSAVFRLLTTRLPGGLPGAAGLLFETDPTGAMRGELKRFAREHGATPEADAAARRAMAEGRLAQTQRRREQERQQAIAGPQYDPVSGKFRVFTAPKSDEQIKYEMAREETRRQRVKAAAETLAITLRANGNTLKAAQVEADQEYLDNINSGTKSQAEAFAIRKARYKTAAAEHAKEVEAAQKLSTEQAKQWIHEQAVIGKRMMDLQEEERKRNKAIDDQRLEFTRRGIQTYSELIAERKALLRVYIDMAFQEAQARAKELELMRFPDMRTRDENGLLPSDKFRPRSVGMGPDATAVAAKKLSEANRRGVGMKARIEQMRAAMRDQFSFLPDLASNLADEFYDGFSQGLQRIFGKNPLGRALARTLDRWFSQMLDQALASIFTGHQGGYKAGLPPPASGIMEGDNPMGLGRAQGPIIIGLLGLLNKNLGGLASAIALLASGIFRQGPVKSLMGGFGGGGLGPIFSGGGGLTSGIPGAAVLGIGPLFQGIFSGVGDDRPFANRFSPSTLARLNRFNTPAMGMSGVSISVNTPSITVREEADIHRIAERLAWETQQKLRTRF